jgi:hypothetical protein
MAATPSIKLAGLFPSHAQQSIPGNCWNPAAFGAEGVFRTAENLRESALRSVPISSRRVCPINV